MLDKEFMIGLFDAKDDKGRGCVDSALKAKIAIAKLLQASVLLRRRTLQTRQRERVESELDGMDEVAGLWPRLGQR